MTRKRLTRRIDKRLKREGLPYLEKISADMGDHDGVVAVPGTSNMVYVRVSNGQVVKVFNDLAPNEYNRKVTIGRDKYQPTIWKIIDIRWVYDTDEDHAHLLYHHEQHEYPNPDAVFVRRDQFSPLLILPAGGFNVRFYGDVIYKFGMSAPIRVENADIDLSSYVITAGAKYVRLDVDTSGTLVYTVGNLVGSRDVLEVEPLPIPGVDSFPVAAFIFYEGQTELRRDSTERTIIDLRMFTSDVITDAITQFHNAPEKVTIGNNDEFFGADSADSYSATKWLWSTIKNAIIAVTDALYSALGHTHEITEGHAHGLMRWMADGATASYELPDIAEYVENVTNNGVEVDITVYSLSANQSQIIFDSAPIATDVLQASYVIAQV
jgi:hypothetical protein